MRSVLNAGRDWGWLLALGAVCFILFLLYTKELPRAVGVPLPGDEDVTNVIAIEPGINYDVATFCNDPSSKVSLGVPLEVRGTHYVISRGQEQIDYKDTEPSGSNPNAQRYWISAAGIQQSAPVQMTVPALECAKKKLSK